MKSVLISIRQQWCSLIASGKKTVEVRKTKPKLDTPFKVYIYCTKSKKKTRIDWMDEALGGGMVIGEFMCDRVYQYASDMFRSAPVEGTDISTEDMTKLSCLTAKELYDYEHSAEPKENCICLVGVYGWHISDLVIYDKPKPLGEFYKECAGLYDIGMCYECEKAVGEECECTANGRLFITRPPQSWCYVEEL